jgi:hypothetical protein
MARVDAAEIPETLRLYAFAQSRVTAGEELRPWHYSRLAEQQ